MGQDGTARQGAVAGANTTGHGRVGHTQISVCSRARAAAGVSPAFWHRFWERRGSVGAAAGHPAHSGVGSAGAQRRHRRRDTEALLRAGDAAGGRAGNAAGNVGVTRGERHSTPWGKTRGSAR